MLLAAVIAYLLANIAIGWWASRRVKTSQDFVLAGRNLPLLMAATTTFATWFGSETVMGASAEFAQHGLLGVIEDPFGAALCLLLVGLLIARPLYRLNILTFCDYFAQRFGVAAEVLGALLIIPSYFGWIAAQLVAMGLVLHSLAGISVAAGVLISTAVVVAYTYWGGLWAVSITDLLQTVVIIAGLGAVFVMLWVKVQAVPDALVALPADFFRFTPKPRVEDWVQYIVAWMTIGLGSVPQQDVFQRVMAARSERVAVRASYLAAAMYLTIAFIPLGIALMGKALYPSLFPADMSTLSDAERQQILPAMMRAHSPLAMQILFFGALLSAIMSTTSGAILAPATVVAENLWRKLRPQAPDTALLRSLRAAVVGIALVSALMALRRGNIYELVGESSAMSLVSLFVPLMAGLYWRRASLAGCLAAMLLGMGVWLACGWAGTSFPPMLYGLLASVVGMAAGSWAWPSAKKA